jgi:hypothetical protein
MRSTARGIESYAALLISHMNAKMTEEKIKQEQKTNYTQISEMFRQIFSQ